MVAEDTKIEGGIRMLRRGSVVAHSRSEKKGVLIDWGVYNQKYKKYMLVSKDAADCIRVWTAGAIEVWPLSSIRPSPS